MTENNLNKIKGFTLAETLIALTIVGILAVLVIPALINRTNEEEYNVGVKKALADLSHAVNMLQSNGAVIHAGTASGMGDAVASNVFRNDFCNVMNCAFIGIGRNILAANYKYYKGGYIGWPDAAEQAGSAVLSNGSLVRFYSYDNCNYYGVRACGDIHIDINGKKGPNMVGKDFHFFYITYRNGKYSIAPGGVAGDTRLPLPGGCTAGSTTWNTSDGCTAKRLINPDNMP